MALHKKSGHGLDIEERLKKQLGLPEDQFTGGNNADTPTDTYTYTHTDTATHAVENDYQYKKETKSKRLYLLAKPSVHQKLEDYAKKNGDSFNNLVHRLMEEFIEKNGL